jgi:L-aspartate oxidase
MQIQTDHLIIGSGVAGLFLALKLAEFSDVLVMTKAEISETNTRYAQGGIAGVFSDQDSFDQHVQDTLVAGDGLCDAAIVTMVVEQGPERIRELMQIGAQFDKSDDGKLLLAKEGGHSASRILHAQDATGAEIERALVLAVRNHPRIQVLEHLFALDLITQHHKGMYINRGNDQIECYGAYALDLNSRNVITILAGKTILATGGAGNVYASTTNPAIATGDGIAMALRAKARIANMEFCQFHPTAFYEPGVRPSFLITEALRGKGAILKSGWSKEPFMQKYDERLSLAPRDIVARAIDNEMKISGTEHVWLDATHLDAQELKKEFPGIFDYCLQKGIDITQDLIPVLPAMHYLCGGIEVNKKGRSSIHHLYACGECSHTGLHGANRLASNSLLEGVVFAGAIAEDIQAHYTSYSYEKEIPAWNDSHTANTDEWVLVTHNFKEVRNIMSNYVGIVRSNARLERATRRIALIYQETETFYQKTRLSPEICELRNLIACAYLIIKCAQIRKESRGLHFNSDYPQKSKDIWNTRL